MDEKRPMSGREAYNLASDTIGGANIRLKDNLFQGLAILVCLVLGVIIGALVASDRAVGAIAGGFAGVLVGLFGSGTFLMVFRAIRHAKGRHD